MRFCLGPLAASYALGRLFQMLCLRPLVTRYALGRPGFRLYQAFVTATVLMVFVMLVMVHLRYPVGGSLHLKVHTADL